MQFKLKEVVGSLPRYEYIVLLPLHQRKCSICQKCASTQLGPGIWLDPWCSTIIDSTYDLNWKKWSETHPDMSMLSRYPFTWENVQNIKNAQVRSCIHIEFLILHYNIFSIWLKLKEMVKNSPRYEYVVLLPLHQQKCSIRQKRANSQLSSH